jgi:hypothetical protein
VLARTAACVCERERGRERGREGERERAVTGLLAGPSGLEDFVEAWKRNTASSKSTTLLYRVNLLTVNQL